MIGGYFGAEGAKGEGVLDKDVFGRVISEKTSKKAAGREGEFCPHFLLYTCLEFYFS